MKTAPATVSGVTISCAGRVGPQVGPVRLATSRLEHLYRCLIRMQDAWEQSQVLDGGDGEPDDAPGNATDTDAAIAAPGTSWSGWFALLQRSRATAPSALSK